MALNTAPRRATIAVAALSGALVIAACGSSKSPAGPSARAQRAAAGALAYSQCMRSHGVSNFPDPTISGGGAHISIGITSSSGINPSSPSFQAAQKACGRLAPGGGPSSQHPSAATEKQMLAIAACMRTHGISDFPDPTTSPPSTPGAGVGGVMTQNGVSFVFPSTLDLTSPAVVRAAKLCHFPVPGGPGGPTPAG
jgi:hypothetical protein